jgi:Glycosyltransferase 61
MQSRNRYEGFSASGLKIHPFKRAAALLARFLPPSWRFILLGLPARARPATDPTAADADAKISRLKDGIACQIGAHLNSRYAYLTDLTPGAGEFIESCFVKRQRCFPKIRQVDGTVLSLVHEGDSNYYRWLMETLPRMRYVREAACTFDWLYCRQQQRFHRESMASLGWDSTRLIASDQNKFVRARQLAVPRFVDEAESWVIPWLQEQFLPLAQDRKAESLPKRVYISRRKATGRRVANESELMRHLESAGFTSVVLEDWKWLDQIALFRNAEAVIGSHGAGLANLVFCSAGTTVIELIAESYPFNFYPEISRQNRLEHHTLSCLPVAPNRVFSSDLVAHIESVLRLVNKP